MHRPNRFDHVDMDHDRPRVVYVTIWEEDGSPKATFYWDAVVRKNRDLLREAPNPSEVPAVLSAAQKEAAEHGLPIFVRISDLELWNPSWGTLKPSPKAKLQDTFVHDVQRRLRFFRRKFRWPSFAERPSRSGQFTLHEQAMLNPGERAELEEEISRSEARFSRELHNVRIDAAAAVDEQKAIQLHLAEISSLRSEILDIKNRDMATQAIALGILGAIHYALWKDFAKEWLEIGKVVASLIPVIAITIGYMRFQENRRNIFEIDNYLIEIEKEFDPKGGWATYFFQVRPRHAYFYSSSLIWYTLVAAAIFGVIITIFFAIPWNSFVKGEGLSPMTFLWFLPCAMADQNKINIKKPNQNSTR